MFGKLLGKEIFKKRKREWWWRERSRFSVNYIHTYVLRLEVQSWQINSIRVTCNFRREIDTDKNGETWIFLKIWQRENLREQFTFMQRYTRRGVAKSVHFHFGIVARVTTVARYDNTAGPFTISSNLKSAFIAVYCTRLSMVIDVAVIGRKVRQVI